MNARLKFDQNVFKNKPLMGLDEVGWGCISGDLVLGAVVITPEFWHKLPTWIKKEEWIDVVRDSKKLTEKKRELIKASVENFDFENTLQVIYGTATVAEINEVGLAKAFDLCVERILSLAPKNVMVLLDGKRTPKSLSHLETQLVIKGDDTSWLIGLASVMAKTFRDQHMKELDRECPGYGFSDHKGYGTSSHVEALKRLGITRFHRNKSTETILS